MISWFKKRLEENPDGLFLKFEDNSYTISDLAREIASVKKAFSASGIKSKDRLVILLPNGVEIVEIILSCFETGVIAVPLSPKFTEKELGKILDEIQPVAIVTNWVLSKKLSGNSIPVVCVEEISTIAGSCQDYEHYQKINPKDICTILMTSGTTNSPKAVQLTYQNFQSSCKNWNQFLNFIPGDQFLCCLPLTHVGGLAVLIRALIYGFSINLSKSFSSDLLYQILSKDPVTIVSLVPTMLQRIIDQPDGIRYLKSLRAILLGGGPVSDVLLDTCIKKNLPIVKTYGMTETCSGIVGLWLLDKPEKKHFAGAPFPNVSIKVENEEIIISGPMVMKGYLNQSASNGTHNSKDLGWMDVDGTLFLEMRRKDLIVTGGENVNPKEVEDLLISMDEIKDAVVFGIPDKEWGQKVAAVIVLRYNNLQITNKDITDKLRDEISAYKIPKIYKFVDSISRNELGKINNETLKIL